MRIRCESVEICIQVLPGYKETKGCDKREKGGESVAEGKKVKKTCRHVHSYLIDLGRIPCQVKVAGNVSSRTMVDLL